MKRFLLAFALVLSISVPCSAAVTMVTSHTWQSAAVYMLDATLTTGAAITANVGTSNVWFSHDFGINQLVGSAVLYSGVTNAGADFPKTVTVQVTSSPVLTVADGNAASWTTIASVSGITVGATSPVMFGFGELVSARAIRFLFPQPSTHAQIYFGNLSFSGLAATIDAPVTADTYTTINKIYSDTQAIKAGVTSLDAKVADMDPLTITQSISFLLGAFTGLAFVVASSRVSA